MSVPRAERRDVIVSTYILYHNKSLTNTIIRARISRIGATGVCPGTQYCSRVEDFELGCKQVTSGNRYTNANTTTNIHKDTGIWLAGDAVLMNQNTFHRGWKHDMQNGPDRGMKLATLFDLFRFDLTFTIISFLTMLYFCIF